MAIADTGSFQPGSLSFSPSLDIKPFDQRPLGQAVATMARIETEKSARIGQSISDYTEAKNSLGASFVSPYNTEIYNAQREQYGLSDADLQLSEDDIKDGYAVRNLSSKAQKFAASPIVKKAMQDDIAGQAFGQLYGNLSNEKMRSLAESRYNDFRSGLKPGSELNLSDYEVVDHREDLAATLKRYAPERQYSRMAKDGTEVKFYARDQDAVSSVASMIMSNPKYQNMAEAGLLTQDGLTRDLSSLGAFNERITNYERPASSGSASTAEATEAEKATAKLNATQRSGLERLQEATGDDQLVLDNDLMSTIGSVEKFATRAFEGRAQMLDQDVYHNAIGFVGIGKLGVLTPELGSLVDREYKGLFDTENPTNWSSLLTSTDPKSLQARSAARNKILENYTTEVDGVPTVNGDVKSLGTGMDYPGLVRKVDDAIGTYIKNRSSTGATTGAVQSPAGTSVAPAPRNIRDVFQAVNAKQNMSSPLMTAIVKAENGGRVEFDRINDGSSTGTRKPELLKMPVSQLPDGTTIGSFQIQKATAIDMMSRVLKLDPETTMLTPEVQGKIAEALLERRGKKNFEAGLISIDEYADNLSIEWRGLPFNDGNTYSDKYAGGNSAQIGRAQFINSIALSSPVQDFNGTPLQVAPQTMNGLRRASADFEAVYGVPMQVGTHAHNGVRSIDKQLEVYSQGRTLEQLKSKVKIAGLNYSDKELREIYAKADPNGKIVTDATISSEHISGSALDMIQSATVTVGDQTMTNDEYRTLIKPFLEKHGFEFSMPKKDDPMHIRFNGATQ